MLELLIVTVVLVLLNAVLNVKMPYFMVLFLGLMSVGVSFVIGGFLGSLFGYYVVLLYVGGLMVVLGFILCLYPNQDFIKPEINGVGFLGFGVYLSVSFISFFGSSSAGSLPVWFGTGVGLMKYGNFFSWGYSGIVFLLLSVFLLFAMVVAGAFGVKSAMPLRVREKVGF